MDGAVIFFFVLAGIILAFTITALVSVHRSTKALNEDGSPEPRSVGSFQQRLIEINRVPDPKGRGTIWTPTE